jgi:glutamate decarboxylase
MVLARHVNPDEIVSALHTTAHKSHSAHHQTNSNLTPYSNKYSINAPSRHTIPKEGAPANSVAQMIRDELDLDGRTNLNLASFVHTWMEPEADKLMMENIAKNMSDADEYPALMDIHARCISQLAHLWGVQKGERAIGSASKKSLVQDYYRDEAFHCIVVDLIG